MAPKAHIVISKFHTGTIEGIRRLRCILLERMAVAETTVCTIYQLFTMVKKYLSHQPLLITMSHEATTPLLDDIITVLKMFPECFVDTSIQYPGEEWSLTEAARDLGTTGCFGAFTDRDDDHHYWSTTSGEEIMFAEILYVLAVNTDPISILDIFHAVHHKVWTEPAAVTSGGWPSLPTYS